MGVTAKWYVVFTKPKQEKLAEEHLCRQGYHCFLPFAKNPNKIRSRRVKVIVEPLFPRYLFIKVDTQTQSIAPVKSTQGVVNIVMFGNMLASISEKIIDQIQDQLNSESGLVELNPIEYKPGDKVRVLDGPLAGLEGTFNQTNGKDRVILLLNLLGSNTKVQVQKEFLDLAT
jgi:transcriptional antiterminator RfaH